MRIMDWSSDVCSSDLQRLKRVCVVVACACPRPERRVCRPKCVALLVVIDAAKIGASLKKAVDIVVPGGRGSDQISLAFKVDLLPGYVRFQCGEVQIGRAHV